jgi:hypothetical protein
VSLARWCGDVRQIIKRWDTAEKEGSQDCFKRLAKCRFWVDTVEKVDFFKWTKFSRRAGAFVRKLYGGHMSSQIFNRQAS